jgi:hypothetical protein
MTTPLDIETLQNGLRSASRDKAVAELKLQAAFLTYASIHISGNLEAEIQSRAGIHAIIDVMLDAEAIKYHCLNRLQQAAG